MPQTVCCQSCWTWSELGRSTTCKRCGTPLTFADGRRVDAVMAAAAAGVPAAAMAPEMGYYPPPPDAPAGFVIPRSGPDWVGIARLITIVYGALASIGILVIGLSAQSISVPRYTSTGAVYYQTVHLGPVFVFVAAVTAGLFALFAWVTEFVAARVVFLVLDGLAILGALSSFSGHAVVAVSPVVSAVNLLIDLGYGAVLVMSLIRPQRRPA